jgi:tetratricopeptide (TPR) repeat protein
MHGYAGFGRRHTRRLIVVLLSAALLLGTALLLGGCNDAQERILRRLVATEGGDYKGEEVSKERVAELERQVEQFHDEVVELVKKKGQLGVLYRMLALQYVDNEMYGPALENLEKGLAIYPNNHTMLYYAGLCTGQLAKAQPEESVRRSELEQAARYYQRAIELRRDYVEARYALSVLYVFELERPADAVPHLQEILEVQSDHGKAKFLLARVRAEQGRLEEAVSLYGEIAEESEIAEERRRARENRDQLLERMGGGDG